MISNPSYVGRYPIYQEVPVIPKEVFMFDVNNVGNLIKSGLAPCFKDIRFVIGRDDSGYVGVRNDFILDIDMEAPDGEYNTTMIKSVQKFVRDIGEVLNLNNVFIFIDGKRITIDKQKPFDAVFQEQVEKLLAGEKKLNKMSIFLGGTIIPSKQQWDAAPQIAPLTATPNIPPSWPWPGGTTWSTNDNITYQSPNSGTTIGISTSSAVPVGTIMAVGSPDSAVKMENTLSEMVDCMENIKTHKER